MEIARGRFERAEQRAMVHQAPRNEVHDLAIALDRAVHAEKPCAEQLVALALDEAMPHHDVHVAGLVLQGDEDHAARRVGSLAAGDEARYAHGAAVRAPGHGLGILEAEGGYPVAQQTESM